MENNEIITNEVTEEENEALVETENDDIELADLESDEETTSDTLASVVALGAVTVIGGAIIGGGAWLCKKAWNTKAIKKARKWTAQKLVKNIAEDEDFVPSECVDSEEIPVEENESKK